MRQAGRYMAAFREYSQRYPFRHRSESAEIAIELSLQPYRKFGTDAVIMFSDILTPLPALGVDFDVVSGSGPIFASPLRAQEQIDALLQHPFNPQESLPFVSTILSSLRQTLQAENPDCCLLGFVGAPFTLAAYMIEGKSVKNLVETKAMIYSSHSTQQALHSILSHLANVIAQYAIFQLDNGAQAVQLFDSWAHHLSPDQYMQFAIPYNVQIIQTIRQHRPDAVVIFFANGCAGKLQDINDVIAPIANVVGVDWGVRMSEARRVFGPDVVLQGNVDPSILSCGDEQSIRRSVDETIAQAGNDRLIINLGHGVIKETPEDSVGIFVDQVKRSYY